MSQTFQAALPVRPAVLAVIALHAALVVGIAMNFRYIVSKDKTPDIETFDVPLSDVDPRPEPDRNMLAPMTLDRVMPMPAEPDVPVDQSAAQNSQPVQQPPGDAISQPKAFVWTRPQIVDQTEIPYPTDGGVQPEGIVHLRLRIGIDGRPLEVVLGASSGHRALDRAALKAVAHWRFKPRLLNGQPVESWAEMPIVFRLEN